MFLNESTKRRLRPLKNVCFGLIGFAYDYYRYLRYGGWRRQSESTRGYRAVKIYHRLEKSLSFADRKPGSGTGAAKDLANFYSEKSFSETGISLHERIGLNVLGQFIQQTEDEPRDELRKARAVEKSLAHLKAPVGGVKILAKTELQRGRLQDPSSFFMSRFSVREFTSEVVSEEAIKEAVRLASKTPSVCNRQAWHVYHLQDRDKIAKALSFQNGNRGFGHKIPSLLILTVDLRAFDMSTERYQHWIDGGMYAMSIVLALHAQGLASCCLNWSKGPTDDLKLRREIDVGAHHSILMMLAVGHPQEEVKVCVSARTDVREQLTLL